jgi:hypothetical protein
MTDPLTDAEWHQQEIAFTEPPQGSPEGAIGDALRTYQPMRLPAQFAAQVAALATAQRGKVPVLPAGNAVNAGFEWMLHAVAAALLFAAVGLAQWLDNAMIPAVQVVWAALPHGSAEWLGVMGLLLLLTGVGSVLASRGMR